MSQRPSFSITTDSSGSLYLKDTLKGICPLLHALPFILTRLSSSEDNAILLISSVYTYRFSICAKVDDLE